LAEMAEDLEMPMENLLTPDHLRRVAWSPPAEPTADAIAAALASLGARPWQLEATAQTIADAFVEAEQTVQDATTADS
jgi:ribonuclease D